MLGMRPKSLLDAPSAPGGLMHTTFVPIKDVARVSETKSTVGLAFAMALSSPFPSCTLFAIFRNSLLEL